MLRAGILYHNESIAVTVKADTSRETFLVFAPVELNLWRESAKTIGRASCSRRQFALPRRHALMRKNSHPSLDP
jgi:hypothetical protein